MPLVIMALGATLFLQVGNPIVPPPPIETHTTITNNLIVPPFDAQAVSDASVIADRALIVNIVQPVPVEWANALCALPDVWRTTPANLTVDDPTIRDLTVKTTLVGGGLLGLALLAQALSGALGQGFELPRVLLAMTLSIGNLFLWQKGIGLNNALTAAIGGPDLCASLIKPHLTIQTPDAGEAVGAPVLVIVYAAVSILLLISLWFRLALLDILICAGPIAAMCWASEHSSHIAQWYSRMAVGTIFGQVLLVIGLQVAEVISKVGNGNGLAGPLLSIACLLICRGLLGSLSSQQMQRGGAGMGFWMTRLASRFVLRR